MNCGPMTKNTNDQKTNKPADASDGHGDVKASDIAGKAAEASVEAELDRYIAQVAAFIPRETPASDAADEPGDQDPPEGSPQP